jgi:hypothetical protein
MQKSALDEIAQIFLAIPNLKLSERSNGSNLSVNKVGFKGNDTHIKFLLKHLTLELKEELITKHPKIYMRLERGEPATQLEGIILDTLRERNRKPINYEDLLDSAVPVTLERVQVLIKADDINQSVMYDPDTDVTYPIDYRHRDSVIARHIPDKDMRAQWLRSHSKSCWFMYEPYKPRFFPGKNNALVFNQWKPAPWAANRELDPNVKELPKDFLTVFEHLFPKPEERKYVLYWLRTAMFSRCKTILLMAGIPGCGKGIFLEKILAQLVGPENWTKASANFESSDFHGDIRGKMIYVLNELKLKYKTKEKLKDLADGTGTLNQKNEKVKGVEEIHASFAMSNNYAEENYMEFSDRKFYVPTLNEKKLDDIYGEEWVTHFAEVTCLDPDFLHQIASYLKFNITKNHQVFPKTDLFYKVCEASLPVYFKKFLTFCQHKPTFTERDLSKNNGKGSMDVYSLQSKLEAYEKETGKKIADIHEGLDGWIATSHICAKDNDPVKNAAKAVKAQQKVLDEHKGMDIQENVV